MNCPSCGCTTSRVISTRVVEHANSIKRCRMCIDCRAKFTTYEHLAVSVPPEPNEVFIPMYPPAQEACG